MGDTDLDAFVQAPVREGRRVRRVHPVRAVLFVAAAVAVAVVLGPTRDELAYHFSSRPCVDVGDVVGANLAAVPDGSCARVVAVLGNKAAEIPAWRRGSLRMGPIEVREVVGAPLFLEFDPRAYPALDPFSQVEVEGRMVAFESGELADVAIYFHDRLGVAVPQGSRLLVVGEKPGEMGLYLGGWIAGVSLVVLSLLSLLRDARLRVIPDGADDTDGA